MSSDQLRFFLFHYQLSLGLTSLTACALASFVLTHNPRSTIHRTFALFWFSLCIWSALQALIGVVPEKSLWLPLAKIEHVHIWLPAFFLHFVYAFRGLRANHVVKAAYLISTLFYLTVPTTWLIAGIDYQAVAKYVIEPGFLYLPYIIYFFTVVIYAMWKLWQGIHQGPPEKRRQLQYVFWASLIGYTGGVFNFLYVFDIDVFPLNPLTTYSVPIFNVIMAYAIVRHQLLDIVVIIRKSLVYSLLVTILTVGYFGMIYAVERVFQTTFGYQSPWLSVTAFALMAFVFQPLKVGIQRLVDRLFFHAPHEELVKRMERLEEEVLQSERLKAIATLAAGLAHEIKNPLAAVKTFTDYLPEKHQDPAFVQKFHRIVSQELEKIYTTVQNLLTFAKPEALKREPVAIAHVVEETLALLNGDCVKRHVAVQARVHPELQVIGDRTRLQQALLNLCLNSLDAMEHGGRLCVDATQEDGHVTLSVKDTGTGIDRQDLDHVFEPFFTKKQHGTGLGLSVVHGIVKEHGGRIMIESQPRQGTTVHIQLPSRSL